MPWAPASSARTAACTGSGSAARRACRKVATWSMLTPRRAMPSGPHRHVAAGRLGQVMGPGLDARLVGPFEHDPELGLGAAPADEDAALLAQGRLDLVRGPGEVLHVLERPS